MSSDVTVRTDSRIPACRSILGWQSRDFQNLTLGIGAALNPETRPSADFDPCQELKRRGLMTVGLSPLLGGAGLGLTAETSERLLWLLAAMGEADLSLACLYEQHLSALMLIERAGDAGQVQLAARDAHLGHVFAIWDSDDCDNPVRLKDGRLCGSKVFAAGAGRVTRPLVTATDQAGNRRTFLLDAAEAPIWINPHVCRMVGMLDAVSHSISISGADASAATEIGTPDSAREEPWATMRMLRICATRVGAIKGLARDAATYLGGECRTNPFQLHRIAEMAVEVEGAFAWLERASAAPFAMSSPGETAEVVAYLNMARSAIERSIGHVLLIAHRALGAYAVARSSPAARRIFDLMAGSNQPNPDEFMSIVGNAVLDERASLGRFIEVTPRA